MNEQEGEDGFNLIQPTLLRQLQTILDQYPDDGQILKELIQNAEDAGASQVKFLHDKHSYGTEKLHSKNLAEFQGPALYAYNNAQFTPDDWKGIRMLCDSIKVKDPMKVGRFGLGFKSVFHMTDLPSILSDTRIGFIDPQEHLSDRLYRRTGFSWHLHQHHEAILDLPDQFLPYKGIFDCNDEVFSQEKYNGTLFRFPLRATPSELSKTLYSEEKMQSLFKSFISDAHLVLLFLRNLESIELYTREKSDSYPRRIFQAKISDDSLELVRSKRGEFYATIEPGKCMQEPISVTYPIMIETEMESGERGEHFFLITNYCCGGEVSAHFQRLLIDEELSYLPSVGVAMAIPPRKDLPTPHVAGHVFCALPLPVQKKSMTGLPVHVNGFFALSQNRRHIKTPNADQDNRGQLTDKSLLWNCCLMEEAVPKAYVTMMKEAICKFNVQPKAFYKAWPDIDRIDQAWKRLQNPLLKLLCSEKFIYTQAHGGKWLNVEEAIFDTLEKFDNDLKKLLLRVLLGAHQNVASLPNHVRKAISSNKPDFTEITPVLVRRVLKVSPTCYRDLHRMEKLHLLTFVLRCKDNNFVELFELELFPTADGGFISFTNLSQPVYICSREHPRELLPGLQHRLLDSNIDEGLQRSLEAVADQGCTQLQRLCKDHVPTLLRKSLPSGWLDYDKVQWDFGNEDHPPKGWLKCVWEYLREHFEHELFKLLNIPLIPLDLSQDVVTLTRLTNPSRVVVRSLGDDPLDSTVCDVLEALGVIVMHECPPFLRSHPGVEQFVHPPSVRGVLQAIMASPSLLSDDGMLSAILGKVPDDGKRALRHFISKAQSLYPKEKKLLLCLPLFETLSKAFVSKKHGRSAAPEEKLPVTPRRELIDTKEDDSKKMARLLDIKIPTLTEFLCNEMLPDVKRGCYSEDEIDKLIVFVRESYHVHVSADTRFEEKMKDLPFVSTDSGRFRAMDLFDPRKEQLRDIFADEDVFPTGDQYTDPAVLILLEKLGMKSEKEITALDLYQSAKTIANMSSISTAEKKSAAIMAYLEMNPRKLEENVSETSLGLLLQDVPWISAMRQKPHGFPDSLPFYGESEKEAHFYKPTQVTSEEKVNLIGTVKPIVQVNPSSQLNKYFGWDKMPHASDVVEHFKTVLNCYTQDEKPQYMLVVKDIYSFLLGADHSDVADAMQEIRSSSFIWNGDGFSSPDVVLAEKPSIDLSPYVASLPTEMTQYSELFFTFGMQVQCDAWGLLHVLSLIEQKYDGRGEQHFDSVEVDRDLQLSINILNKVKSEVGDELPPELQEEVLLPTFVEKDAYVKLAPVEKCVYCEHDWLRPLNDDDDMNDFFVHPNVPNSTAEFFNVRTLCNSMLDPDEIGVGEEFGQEEKLTRRLNRLLEDYTDGFAVPKELIQNADDAGATEVRFLYDERSNEDALACLIDEGMKDCQGPALWVYNDAVFQNKDFENLTKLNGATKEQDTQTIGKFGLGFNAVYNLTDVPMLVSRNYFVIFDPNTFYLGKAIRNKNKPGIKIDTNKNVKKLRNFRNQFKPFNGIFDCDLHLDKEDNSFQGTLFRFPLRTKEQAIKSEIKQLVYDCKQVKELLQLFIKGARSLLLFTQNVRRVSIFHLPRESTDETQPKLIFEVTKSLSQQGILRELPLPVTLPLPASSLNNEDQFFLKQCNFLRASSEAAKCAGETQHSSTALLRSALTLDIQSNVTESGHDFFEEEVKLPSGVETWLVASSMGNGQAMQFSQKEISLLPSAGVAVQLLPNDAFVPEPVCILNRTGSLFCYLPLPIHSGLPVHVNGAFAVASNRRSLKEKTEDDKACVEVEWNNILLEDSVCAAYLDLLHDVGPSTQASRSTYQFHALWPKSCNVEKTCEPLARSFYEHLVSGSISLFSDGNRWVSIHDVVFLEPQFRNDPRIGDIAFQVFQMFVCENEAVIDLPADVYQSFVNYGHEKAIQSRRYDKTRFFRELFFPNIGSVASPLRDNLVLYALDQNKGVIDRMIKTYACIPASPHGQTLKCPSQLISPNRDAAFLFCLKDERFPHGSEQTFLNLSRLFKLEQLGMLTDDLSWPEVAERAESISILNQTSNDAAIQRAKNLLDFLERKLNRDDDHLPSDGDQTRILQAKFLPVLKKPKSFPLIWKGSETTGGNQQTQTLVSPVDGFLSDQRYLVCCSEPVIEATTIPAKAKAFLMLERNQPTVEHVMYQLDEAISTSAKVANAEKEEIRNVCTASYRFLQEALESDEKQITNLLQEKEFILVRNTFVHAKQVAFNLAVDCPPYLHKLPEDLARSYSTLMKVAGVRDVFEVEDFISALKRIKQQFQERRLDEETLRVVVNLATQLEESLKISEFQPTNDDKRASIHLPNSNGVMQLVSELCIKDCPWIPGDIGVQFVNPMIPTLTSFNLGVKTRRIEVLRRHHAFGMSFGQREKLTNRLKRILTAYPCEKELLKELLQNADDAGASEICFIKDPRSHPKTRVFEKCWEPLQGPALCVYNNKPFTHADIEGIQNLGEGSKGDDPNKTGQYGVGFNAVYHLTDVPSFMSSGQEIGDVLCVFDPHCQYVPDANPQEPGRMYTEITQLKDVFPDVFSCYLEEHFPIKNSTMFRFPLRTQEMAQVSKLSTTAVTLKTLNEMMDSLKNELFEVLLFVNNVKKITLCDIDEESGKVVNKYSVEVVMSDEDVVKRYEFASHIKQIGKLAKERETFPSDIEVKRCSYFMTLKDSVGNEEKWFIVQQFGLENPLSKSIVHAYQTGDLGMLPRGGVACLLEEKSKTNSSDQEEDRSRVTDQEEDSSRVTDQESLEKKHKAYCFLPLPIETNLPVHINGHFALDQARRNLWRDEKGGYRSDWNNVLLGDVIALCYLTLLDEVRRFYQLPMTPDEANDPSCCEQDVVKRIEEFEKLFPQFDGNDSYWNTLVRSVYKKMDDKRLRLLPVVRSASQVQLTWLPPTGTGNDQAFFNNLGTQDEKDLAEILIQTGFNLVCFSLSVFESFKKSDVNSSCVSPSSVVDFFKTFSCQGPLCGIGPIPINVCETPFKDDIGVALMLMYCKKQIHFLKNLPGLPLLLTQDNILRVFDCADQKFLSGYHDILPNSKQMFVHERIRTRVFNDLASRAASVFRPFDVSAFATYLHHSLPDSYYGSDGYVKWNPDNVSQPNQRWIFRVWSFLKDVVASVLRNRVLRSEGETLDCIRAALDPLSHWSILPATEVVDVSDGNASNAPDLVKEDLLVPLKLAEAILDFNETSSPLVSALRHLGLPELNSTLLCASSLQSEGSLLTKKVVASPSKPASVLMSLHQKMTRKPQSLQDNLDPSGCKIILQYFSQNVYSLKNILPRSGVVSCKDILRKLPFYLATHGGLVSLDNQRIFVLPSGIPREEMANLEDEVNVLFLESVQDLSNLYEFLAFDCISSVDVYCQSILAHFNVFSREARQKHLKYIRDSLLNYLPNEYDKQRLLHCLSSMEVITTNDGALKKASCFHHPHNEVFKAMLPDDRFPPEPFNSPDWLPFMKKIGMIHDVSREHFISFAKQIAQEASMRRTEKTDEKSKVLVSNLFKRSQILNDGLLQAVCDVRFVASDPVRDDLKQLHRPYSASEDGQTPYISFKDSVLSDHDELVWTTAYLLPRWADPRFRFEMKTPYFLTRDAFTSSVLSQLHVLSDPTLQMVTSHCLKISHQLAKENDSKFPEVQGVTRTSVMRNIYRFLQEKGRYTTSSDVKDVLENAPCILVENGGRFVQAKQVVLELYESLEIPSFLYGVPPEFGEFHKLFLYLGCSNSVKASHYAMVLEMLHDQCQSNKLNPNEIKSSLKAVKGLFEVLEQDPEEKVGLPNLYLPALNPFSICSIDNRPVTLHKSTDLIFDDAPHYQSRLESFNQLFVVDLKRTELQCNSSMNYKDYILRLPADLRPQLLSSVVEEHFVDSLDSGGLVVHVTVADSLKRQLCSEQFFHGILRLIRHANHGNKTLNESAIVCVENRLRSIELLGLSNIVTQLMYKGGLIQGSVAEVPHFVDKVSESGKGVWKVYVNAMVKETQGKILLILTQVIEEACEGLLRQTVMFIPEILRTDPSNIWSILDDMKIRQDDSYDPSMSDLLPQPGDFIPIEDHHLLNEAFEEFTPGEYVGFELDDPSLEQENGDATFIYAIIIEEDSSEKDASIYTKLYKVNVGHDKEPQVAESADLYKFHRLHSTFGLSDDQESFTQAIDKTNVLTKISEVLKMVWSLPDKRRRKIIKRLFLQWHPEKGFGDVAFRNEVFQHLQNEIAKLESDEAASNQASHYGDFLDVWRIRARRHRTQRQQYGETFIRTYGSWEASTRHRSGSGIPPSFCKKNPQPGEARRWFRQAEADLRAANKDLAPNNQSYEWACFKCHQAAEKALKAAQYSDDASKTRVHNLALNASYLSDSQLTSSARQLERCVVDSTRMRYPDQVCYPEIPNDVYTATMAREALGLARTILDRVRQKLLNL